MAEIQGNKDTSTSPDDTLDINQAVEALLEDPAKDNSEDGPDDQADTEAEENDAEEAHEADEEEGSEEEADADQVGEDDQDEDQDEEADDQADEEEYIFEVDGTQVTLEEARLGYLRQSDYTRKTSDVADSRKEAEEATTQLAAERQHYQQMLETLKQQITGTEDEPDWATLEATEDPVTVLQAKERWRDQKDRVQKIEAEHQRVASEATKFNEDRLAETVHKEREALLDKVPEWRDDKVAKAEQSEIRDFMTELGFSAEEAGQVLDHRVVQALRWGLKGWKLETQKKPIAKKKAASAKPLKSKARGKPKSARSKQQRQATERFHKSGDINDAVEMMLAGNA